jgi:hypothetical protein
MHQEKCFGLGASISEGSNAKKTSLKKFWAMRFLMGITGLLWYAEYNI